MVQQIINNALISYNKKIKMKYLFQRNKTYHYNKKIVKNLSNSFLNKKQ